MGREVSLFSLAEYMQMACMGRHTLILEVETEHGRGLVAVCAGEPWSARYGGQRGEEAFCALVNATGSAIQARRWAGPTGPRELLHGCQELLMRAALRKDEAPYLGELVGEGLRAVVAGDYGSAVTLLKRARALDPRNVRVGHQLKRLEALGYGGSSGTEPGAAGLPGCAPIIAVGEPWGDSHDEAEAEKATPEPGPRPDLGSSRPVP